MVYLYHGFRVTPTTRRKITKPKPRKHKPRRHPKPLKKPPS